MGDWWQRLRAAPYWVHSKCRPQAVRLSGQAREKAWLWPPPNAGKQSGFPAQGPANLPESLRAGTDGVPTAAASRVGPGRHHPYRNGDPHEAVTESRNLGHVRARCGLVPIGIAHSRLVIGGSPETMRRHEELVQRLFVHRQVY